MPHIGGSSVVTLGLEQTNLLRSQESCKLGIQLYVKTFSLRKRHRWWQPAAVLRSRPLPVRRSHSGSSLELKEKNSGRYSLSPNIKKKLINSTFYCF